MSTTTTTTSTEAPTPKSVVLNDKHNDTITGHFNYWGSPNDPEESEILSIFSGKSPGLRSVACPVTDIRSLEGGLSHVTFSTHGFQVLKHNSSLLPPASSTIPNFLDRTLTNATYWPELVSTVKSQLGLRSAVAINTTLRDVKENTPEQLPSDNPRKFAAGVSMSLQPFFIVHGDYTGPGARAHFRAITPTFFEDNDNVAGTSESERRDFFALRDEIIAAENIAMEEEGVTDPWAWSGKNYTGPRWAMLSVWRPLEPVSRDPLAIMDPRTLLRAGVEKPYIALQRTYRDRPGFEKEFRSENLLAVAPQEERGDGGHNHQWYYISHQTPEEVYALKLFDSEAHREGGVGKIAPFAAHSAFALPEQEDEKLRRSVEIRMMVIW